MSSADIVIIGGGCMGTSIAWQLALRRAGRIVLVEKQGLAMGATGKSSAVVRTHYTHEALARMSLRALRVFENFQQVVGGDAGFRRTGFLALVSPRDVSALAANVTMHRRVGIDAHVLKPADLRALEPRLSVDGVGAAAWEPQSGYADPHGTTTSYADAARRQGVEFRIGQTVRQIRDDGQATMSVVTEADSIEAPLVVVAAGYRTRELLALLGVDIPLTPIRHNMAIVQRTASFGSMPPIVSDRVLGSYFRPEGAELTLVGTTAAHDGHEDRQVEAERAPAAEDLKVLAARFHARFPEQDAATLRGGFTGVYDCSPDLQPILGPVDGINGLYVAAGFSGHGFKLSPVVGELMAEQICEGHTTLVDLELFSPSRFEANRLITSAHAYSVQTLG